MNFKLPLITICIFNIASCTGSPYGDTKIYREDSFSEALQLSPTLTRSLPGSYVLAGESIETIDLNEAANDSDEGMTYTCFFDTVVDQDVLATSPCDDLPGSADFNTSTAVLGWTTDVDSPGAFEIKITGVDIRDRSAEQVFTISVRPAYQISTDLIKDHSRLFALSEKPNSNSDTARSNWNDLTDVSANGVLTGFEFDFSSGWSDSDFSLLYDGVDDSSQHGALDAHSNFTLSSWIKPLDASDADAVIFGSYDVSNQNGFEIRQSELGTGQLELRINFENYSTVVLNSAPVSFYKLNELSGGTAIDSGAAALDGLYNSVSLGDPETPISSEPSVSALFNGTTSNVNLGNNVEHQITGDQSIEMWLRPANFSARRNPFAKAYGGEGTITQETNGRLTYFYGTNGGNGSPYQGFGTTSSLTVNTWHHVVLVRDLTTGNLHWYIDGVLINSVAATYASATAGALTAYIGQGYVSRYAGQISHVAIYDKALTPAEVSSHYDAATATSCISTTSLTNGSWYHIGATYDGSDHKLYINNTEECSVSKVYTASSLPLVMGRDSATAYWNGHIGSFRFYRVSSPSALFDDYTATQSQY